MKLSGMAALCRCFSQVYAAGATRPMRRDDRSLGALRSAALLSTIGLTLVLATVIGFGLGYLLDRWLGTAPWLMLLFTILGIAAGFVEMIRAVIRSSQDEDRDAD
jgi:ATP synthase protein I